jgi:hypothetical protein
VLIGQDIQTELASDVCLYVPASHLKHCVDEAGENGVIEAHVEHY